MTPPVRPGVAGTLYGVAAYVIWGFLPLYFVLLAPVGPWEVLAVRVLLSLVLCVLLLAVMRRLRAVLALLHDRRVVFGTMLAGVLIYINWQTFLIATATDQVVEASLGYFINPIATVLLAVLVLRERLRPTQWAAIVIAGIAVIVIVIGEGTVPWIALVLAMSFGTYGLVKKSLGGRVDALAGMTLETVWLTPVAIAQFVIVALTGGLVTGTAGAFNTAMMAFAGVVTTVPLLLFAASTRRVSLTAVGMMQFLAPVLQLICGVVFLGEHMSAARWIGFGIVWIALIVLVIDMVRAHRRA